MFHQVVCVIVNDVNMKLPEVSMHVFAQLQIVKTKVSRQDVSLLRETVTHTAALNIVDLLVDSTGFVRHILMCHSAPLQRSATKCLEVFDGR